MFKLWEKIYDFSSNYSNFAKNDGFLNYDQILEIKKQTNLYILIIKLSSIYKNEDSYKYKGITVHIFKLLDLPRFYFAGLFSEINGKPASLLTFSFQFCHNQTSNVFKQFYQSSTFGK